MKFFPCRVQLKYNSNIRYIHFELLNNSTSSIFVAVPLHLSQNECRLVHIFHMIALYVSCGVDCVVNRWSSFTCGRSSFDVGIREADT